MKCSRWRPFPPAGDAYRMQKDEPAPFAAGSRRRSSAPRPRGASIPPPQTMRGCATPASQSIVGRRAREKGTKEKAGHRRDDEPAPEKSVFRGVPRQGVRVVRVHRNDDSQGNGQF